MILDRSIVHGQDDPGFNKTSRCRAGKFQRIYLAVIDSWIYDIFVPMRIAVLCVDSQGIAGGLGLYPQLPKNRE